MPQYKLYYFNIKGRAEAIRLIFAQAGVPFEDYRIEHAEWPALKAKMPLGQVPLLEVDGTKHLSQSMAICRYLGKQFGLVGKDDWESALCDMLADGYQDATATSMPWFKEKDEEKKKQVLEGIKKDHFSPFADRYEKFLAENTSGFYIGDNVTWLDLLMFTLEEWWARIVPDVMNAHPKMQQHMGTVGTLPNIKKWLDTRPQTATDYHF